MAKRFHIDLNKCTGCAACMLACAIENELTPGTSWRHVVTFNEGKHPEAPLYHLSLACNHCEDPACLNHCPALAYSRDEATGAVVLDQDVCIGCKYCAWACPYEAPRFDEATGVMAKCTFCNERLAEGQDPACAALCPTGALQCTDREEREGMERVPGFPDADLAPAIRFTSLREDRLVPDATAKPDRAAVDALFDAGDYLPPSRITLRTEWPLAIFTLLAAALVAIVGDAALEALNLKALPLLAAGVAGIILSTLHLGRKQRAIRAIFNLRRSWLSREILGYGIFLFIAALWILFYRSSAVLGVAAAFFGYFTLYAMDRVYDLTLKSGPPGLHSAGVFLTGFFLAGVFIAHPAVVAFFGLIKIVRYVKRKFHALEQGRTARPGLSAIRLGVGFALPSLLWLYNPRDGYTYVLACFLLGELIDRLEFYLELEIETPRRRAALDLSRHVR
jgi:DMSO reductase iron-sulfur subunit